MKGFGEDKTSISSIFPLSNISKGNPAKVPKMSDTHAACAQPTMSKLSRQVRQKSISITPLCHSRCVLGPACKKYMQKVMQVAHTHLFCFLIVSLECLKFFLRFRHYRQEFGLLQQCLP